MVDVPLRHKAGDRRPATGPSGSAFSRAKAARVTPAIRRPRWPRVLAIAALVAGAVLALGYATRLGIDAYRGSLTLSGLSEDQAPVAITIAGERLRIPGNMFRDSVARAGGTLKAAELVVHWPTFAGYSKALDADFKDGSPSAPLVYLTVAERTVALDAAARLDGVYARFFVGDPVASPPGLTARRLSLDSGYDGEIVYYGPAGADRFVARCLPEARADTPATCIRDIAIGRNLTLLYRFNRDIIGGWQDLDRGIRALGAKFIASG
jgi:hypothetical protein